MVEAKKLRKTLKELLALENLPAKTANAARVAHDNAAVHAALRLLALLLPLLSLLLMPLVLMLPPKIPREQKKLTFSALKQIEYKKT